MRNDYPIRDLTCVECGAPFRRRHGRKCRTCRSKDEKRPCPRCARPMNPRAKTCQDCRRYDGEANGHWRGGRYIETSSGYAYALTDGGYVAEHRYVMEQMIGRPLLPEENVHHRNGVRDDNRPDNLELWSTSQPAGQRAVDLLEWARTIVERYEPIGEKIAC